MQEHNRTLFLAILTSTWHKFQNLIICKWTNLSKQLSRRSLRRTHTHMTCIHKTKLPRWPPACRTTGQLQSYVQFPQAPKQQCTAVHSVWFGWFSRCCSAVCSRYTVGLRMPCCWHRQPERRRSLRQRYWVSTTPTTADHNPPAHSTTSRHQYYQVMIPHVSN